MDKYLLVDYQGQVRLLNEIDATGIINAPTIHGYGIVVTEPEDTKNIPINSWFRGTVLIVKLAP